MKRFLPLTTLFLLTILYIIIFYGTILKNPNSYYFTDAGDGIKGYFAYAYHIKHDTSYVQFQGMGYPYGENHLFTDGQTAIADIVKLASEFVPRIESYSIGIYNLMMILSFIPCALLLYLILKRLRMPWYYSVFGAIVITFLSPQIFRIYGHFSLSYCFFFPLTWYLLIVFFESNPKKRILISSLLALSNTFWAFVHPYYLLISCLFLLAYWIFYFIQNTKRSEHKKLSSYLHLFLQALLPLILFKLYTHFTDFHEMRSVYPYGLFVYNARLNTVFIPHHPPFNSLFDLYNLLKGQAWEGWAYIGIPSLIVAILSFIKLIRSFIKKKFKAIKYPNLPPVLATSTLAAIILLLYSLSFPYNIGFTFILDWFPFLYQFRSLGRFAWVFFYVFSVFSIYQIYLSTRLLRMRKLYVFSICIPVIALFLYFSEGIPYHTMATSLSSAANLFNNKQITEPYQQAINSIDRNKYQAIIPLPYYQVGNENFSKPFSDACMKTSQVISYHTGIPLVAVSSARFSISEGKKLMQLLAPPFMPKEYMNDLKSKKPFLIMWNKENITDNEKELISRSVKYFENDLVVLYELSYENLFINTSEKELQRFASVKDSLTEKNNFMYRIDDSLIYSNNFEDTTTDITLRGRGSYEGVIGKYSYIFKDRILNVNANQEYVLSFWYYNVGELRNQNVCVVKETDASDNIVKETAYTVSETFNITDQWSMVEMKFTVNDPANKISIFLKGDGRSKMPFYLDELMIRPYGSTIYKVDSTNANGEVVSLFKNNYIIANSR